MAGGITRCRRDLFRANPVGYPQPARAAAARMVLCADHAPQQPGAHVGYNPRAHGCHGQRRAARSGILFVALFVYWISLDDFALTEDEQNARAANSHVTAKTPGRPMPTWRRTRWSDKFFLDDPSGVAHALFASRARSLSFAGQPKGCPYVSCKE